MRFVLHSRRLTTVIIITIVVKRRITLERRNASLYLSRYISYIAIIAKRLTARRDSFDLRARLVSSEEEVKKKKGHGLS